MKKLSLGKLKLLSEEVLQRSQLASIYGGSAEDDYCPRYKCQCSGTGTWHGNYCSNASIANAISNWCESGTGVCHRSGEV